MRSHAAFDTGFPCWFQISWTPRVHSSRLAALQDILAKIRLLPSLGTSRSLLHNSVQLLAYYSITSRLVALRLKAVILVSSQGMMGGVKVEASHAINVI